MMVQWIKSLPLKHQVPEPMLMSCVAVERGRNRQVFGCWAPRQPVQLAHVRFSEPSCVKKQGKG